MASFCISGVEPSVLAVRFSELVRCIQGNSFEGWSWIELANPLSQLHEARPEGGKCGVEDKLLVSAL